MALKDRITEALNRRGATQAALAQQLEVSPATVSAWCNGSKRPSPTNMERIAAFLGVTPGYLSFGEGTAAPGVDLAPQRTRYEQDLEWYWRPAPRDRGREFGNAAAYAFEVDIPTLGRESGQNTSDEKVETEPTVELRYTVSELSGQNLDNFLAAIHFDAIRPHLEAAATTNLKAGSVIGRGLGQLDDEGRLLIIRVEDYGANGLTGPEFDRGRFMAVARNTLDSQKSGTAGGSFGLGWATLPASSQFGLVLCNSALVEAVDGRSRDRFIGAIDLPWHRVSGVEYAGKGWLGQEDPDDDLMPPKRTISYWGNEALVRDTFLHRTDPRPGTSFLIVGAYDASGAVNEVEEIAEKFAESLADNFWPGMVERPDAPARLQVIVRAERNGDRILENYVDPTHYQPTRVAAFQKHLRDDVAESLENPGDVVRRNITLRVPRRSVEPTHAAQEHQAVLIVTQVGEDDGQRGATVPNTVTYMRGSQMVIQRARVGTLPIGARTFQAVVLAGEAAGDGAADRAADRFLRAAEPPAHNKWTGTPEITTSYARGGKTAIDTFDAEVKKAIREIIRQPSRDLSDGPDSLKELIRIVPPPPAGKRPQVKSVAGHRITDGGAWEITDATVTLPPRPGGKGWTLSPVLRFGTESGAPIPVKWEHLTPVTRCSLDERGRLVTPPTARTAVFSATSDPSSHPVGAHRAAVVVDVRVHTDEVRQ